MSAQSRVREPSTPADWNARLRREALALLLWAAPLAFLGLFYFYPLLSIFRVSFARLDGVQELLSQLASPAVRGVTGFTFGQALLSTLLTLVVGLPGAYLLARYEFPGKPLFRALTGVPFVMPTLVVAASFNALLGSRGWLNQALMSLFDVARPPIPFTNTLGAILLAHVFYNTTIVLRIVGDYWSRLDPDLVRAARVLGATPFQAFRKVTLPLLAPAIAAASLLVFIFDFTSFGVILVLGGPRFATLETEIYYQVTGLFNLPLAAALALIQLACTLAFTVLYTRLSNRISRPISLSPQKRGLKPLKSWRARLLAGALLALMIVLLLLPLISLAGRSVLRLEPDRGESIAAAGLTLEFYRALFENPRQSLFIVSPAASLGISVSYALATVALSLLLGIPAAVSLARSTGASTGLGSWLNRMMDPLLMLPLGTSAITLGLGFIVALNRPPLDLRASPVLIPLAHTLVAFPFVVRSLTPALRSVQPQLRHAASVLGASPWQVLRRVDLPLVGRAFLVAAAFAFTISLGEFGATALLARPEYPTAPVAIYRFLARPGGLNYGQALALSTILMLVCTAGMLLIEHLRVGGEEF